jgi:hypothetical protein
MVGILHGRGETARCMMTALRVTLAGTRLSKDCQLSIEWISKPLPEGKYSLTFDDKTVQMHYSQGAWKAIAV